VWRQNIQKKKAKDICSAEFENPTSVPLIALVDTITPVPLLYHVRTFYILRYNSLTTHLSQPTYTINELQKKKKKKKQGGRKRLEKEAKEDKQKEKRKERKKTQRTHSQTQIEYNLIIVKIITIPTSTTNKLIHHFKLHSTS